MEGNLKRRERRTKLQNAILSSLELGGVLTLAILAPNVLQLLGKRYSNRSKESIETASQRLLKKGLISYEEGASGRRLRITPKGSAFLVRKSFVVRKPAKWDGRWRMVIFDIAEARKGHRHLLRKTLVEIGFERLQDSVWVFPYDCEELITLLKVDYGLGKEVLYIIADTIERDSHLRTKFSLK